MKERASAGRRDGRALLVTHSFIGEYFVFFFFKIGNFLENNLIECD